MYCFTVASSCPADAPDGLCVSGSLSIDIGIIELILAYSILRYAGVCLVASDLDTLTTFLTWRRRLKIRSIWSIASISNVAVITAFCDEALVLEVTAVILIPASDTTAATSRRSPARSRATMEIGARYCCGSICNQLTSTKRSRACSPKRRRVRQSLRCTIIPLPGLKTPTMPSPGIGQQQCASLTIEEGLFNTPLLSDRAKRERCCTSPYPFSIGKGISLS